MKMMGCDKIGEGIPGQSSGGRESLLHWLFLLLFFSFFNVGMQKMGVSEAQQRDLDQIQS